METDSMAFVSKRVAGWRRSFKGNLIVNHNHVARSSSAIKKFSASLNYRLDRNAVDGGRKRTPKRSKVLLLAGSSSFRSNSLR